MLYQAAYLQPFMIQAARSCKCCPPSSWRWGVAPLGWESRRGSLRTLHPPEPWARDVRALRRQPDSRGMEN